MLNRHERVPSPELMITVRDGARREDLVGRPARMLAARFDARLDVLLSRLDRARAEDDLTEALDAFRRLVGLDWHLFAISRVDSLQSLDQRVFTNATGWMERYRAERLDRFDPVVRHMVRRQRPVTWDSFRHDEAYNGDEQLAVMERAREHGLEVGFSIPCNSFGTFAVFSMAHSDDTAAERFGFIVPYAHTFASHLLDAALRLGCATSDACDRERLTPRETECLFWGSEGKTAWEIGRILGVEERTVVFHFGNATRKLGASSRQHAVSKAILRGLIRPRV